MINILGIYEQIKHQKQNDKEFMEDYLKVFFKFSQHKIQAIKSLESKYITATAQFMELIGIQSIESIIDVADENLQCSMSNFAINYKNQDRRVVKSRKMLTTLEIQEFAINTGLYIFCRKPIINPNTNNVLGICITAKPFIVNNLLEVVFNIYRPQQPQSKFLTQYICPRITLGKKQLDVLFCLYIGIKEYKAIANLISLVTGENYTEHLVRAAIKPLYLKFQVNSCDQLIEEVIKHKLYRYFPSTFIKLGSYEITKLPVTVAPMIRH